jgi:DNA-binding XRE family transcriptional regulator
VTIKDKEQVHLMTLREHCAMFGSQEKAAADIGVATNTYQLWYSGHYRPCWKSIEILSKKGIKIETFPD